MLDDTKIKMGTLSSKATMGTIIMESYNHRIAQAGKDLQDHRIIESQNHRMAWVEKDHNDH